MDGIHAYRTKQNKRKKHPDNYLEIGVRLHRSECEPDCDPRMPALVFGFMPE